LARVPFVHSSQLKYRETIADGLENAPRAFIGLYHGENRANNGCVWRP
jgi:NADPH-dependent curcumin reductase CurA